MPEYSIEASVRGNMSRSYRKELFRKGLIPAVVYGKTLKSLSLEVPEKEVKGALQAGRNTIINLKVSGNGGPYKVMVRDLQLDPINKTIIHADFQQISLRDKIRTSVPIHISGRVSGGLARIVLRNLEISCLPARIPDRVTVDVTGMEPGDSITVSDLDLPKGVNVLDDPGATVVTVTAPAEETGDSEGGETPGNDDEKEKVP